MSKFDIIWTEQAVFALQEIYNFYKEKSLQAANDIKSDILRSPKTIYFSQQYQLDNINPKYRRIIVRNYKVLYKYDNGSIQILDIVSTKQSPDILKNK